MNTQKNEKKESPFHRIVFRLWAQMMVLVLLAIVFLGVGQIFLFDRNYVQTEISSVRNRIHSLLPQLEENDLAEDHDLFYSLSLSINGKMMILGPDGSLIGAYSFGHPLDLEKDEALKTTWQNTKESSDYQKILNREPFEHSEKSGSHITWETYGIPVRYNGSAAYAVMYHSLTSLYAMLAVNRQQLILLCILLTAAASVLAALLARQFTRPIFTIKKTVDKLTKGDLAAKSDLTRKDELGLLSDSVNTLGDELQRVDVLRKEVIANVSHELKTPLSHIGGYAEMVRDISWKDERKRNEDLNFIVDESRRMSEMVNDILDYSKMQAGYLKLRTDRYNLYEIMESETLSCSKNAEKYQVSLKLISCSRNIPRTLDALKISQVIRNLIYNAVNHTADGGTVTVKAEDIPSGVRVSVINPGEPIPEEDRKLIWERYQRSQHEGGRQEGTGIGLSIVSAILNAHHMPYGVDCHDGLTVFWFESPADSQSGYDASVLP